MWCGLGFATVNEVIWIVENPETGVIVHCLFAFAFDGFVTWCWTHAIKNCARKIQDGYISA